MPGAFERDVLNFRIFVFFLKLSIYDLKYISSTTVSTDRNSPLMNIKAVSTINMEEKFFLKNHEK